MGVDRPLWHACGAGGIDNISRMGIGNRNLGIVLVYSIDGLGIEGKGIKTQHLSLMLGELILEILLG